MNCLHGEPTAYSTTQNGSFCFCNQSLSCDIFFSEDDGYLFEKTIMVWKSKDQLHPRCEECVVKDLMKVNYGRPFFVYSEKVKPCSFWVWGDVQLLPKPECHN